MTRGNGRGPAVCDNGQTAVAAQHKLIVACAVTHDPSARDWLRPMARHAKDVLACRFDAVADRGSDPGHEVKACRAAGSTP
jgi:hypothetical protein